MTATTRRGFLAGTLAAAAAPSLARAQTPPAAGAPLAKGRVVLRGRAIAVSPRGSRVVVAHDRRRTIAVVAHGRTQVVDVGGQPVALAVSPDGHTAAVATAFWDQPGLAFVDLVRGAVRARIDVGPAPCDVAFTPDGTRVLVSGGEQEGSVTVVDAGRLRVVARAAVGVVPRAIAVTPGGDAAWVALNGLDRLVRVDPRSGRAERTLHTPELPDCLAVSPDGRRLLVSHGGMHADHVSEIAVASGKLTRRLAGRLPSAVAWTHDGRGMVALGGAGEIVVFRAGGRRSHLRVGGAPGGLAVAGRSAWTVDSLTGRIARVRR